MQRRALKYLQTWYSRSDRMPLMVRGARQVGKSYCVDAFIQNFSNPTTINFEKQPAFKSCFQRLEPKWILQQIAILSGRAVSTTDPLFLDEIQECPEAIVALRYFKEEMPELPLISAGSLLEFALKASDFAMPVGRIEFLFMHPLSFFEFLEALDEHPLLDFLQQVSLREGIPKAIHQKCLELMRLHITLGGMPAVIDSYLQHGDLLRCRELQSFLLNTYRHDFSKYASLVQQNYCEKLFVKAPGLIAQHFRYRDVDPDLESRKLKVALNLLHKAEIIHLVHEINNIQLPLSAQMNEKKFKLLFIDTGLALAAMRIHMEHILSMDGLLMNQGRIMEQWVGQELLANSSEYEKEELYFWQRDKLGSQAEIDYLIQSQGDVIPLEVKFGKTGRLRSMALFLETFPGKVGIKSSTDELYFEGKILSIPAYLLNQLTRLISEATAP